MAQCSVLFESESSPTDLSVSKRSCHVENKGDRREEKEVQLESISARCGMAADSSCSENSKSSIRNSVIRFSPTAENLPLDCDSTEQLTPDKRAQTDTDPQQEVQGRLTAEDHQLLMNEANMRRYRTAFRPEQVRRLEDEFNCDNYISRPKRNQLAKELGLAEGTIKVWFQNRRMKHKRQQMTAWPLDPRFADPTVAAMLLQAAAASSGLVGNPLIPYLPTNQLSVAPFASPKLQPSLRLPESRPTPVPSGPYLPLALNPFSRPYISPELIHARSVLGIAAPANDLSTVSVTSGTDRVSNLFRPFQSNSPATSDNN